MNAKQINTMLWTAAAMLAAGAVGALGLCVSLPLEHGRVADAGRGRVTTKASAGSGQLPPLAAFDRIWGMSLRQPLGAAAPVIPGSAQAVVAVAPTTAPDGAAPPVALVGTIGTSLALLKTPSNAVEVCGVGETLNGVTVLAVRPAEVDVRYMGRTMKLSKPAE